jgi:DNA-binding FadR family transcriptional regulator
MSESPVLRGPALRTVLQRYIKDFIVSNHLGAGDPLPSEGDLARDLGVSRGSVREAVKALEALGVVEIRHGDGIYVRAFNLDAVLDLLTYGLDFDASVILELTEIRKWLEAATIGDVVGKVDKTEIGELERILKDWEAEIPDGDWGRYDRAYHQALSMALGNRMLTLFLDIFWVAFDNAIDPAIKASPDPYVTLEEHRRVLEGIKAGDESATRHALMATYANLENRIAAVASDRAAGGGEAGTSEPDGGR